MNAAAHWIRPWFPAGLVGHIFADCPDLLDQVPDPVEGAGWLDPFKGQVCQPCVKRHGGLAWDAECDTCDLSMSEEWGDEGDEGPYDEADAKRWKSDHRCEPSVRIIPPTKPRKRTR